MHVLVAYASRHGATAGIAERIAERLRAAGLDAATHRVTDVRGVTAYDAFVIGSAAYLAHWLGEATRFVRQNEVVLASRPVWLFSSGPIGTETVDAQGRDALVSAEPKEFGELRATLHPRGEHVFFGAFDADAKPIGLAERFVRLMPAARTTFHEGDFRDWPVIDAWADGIAASLATTAVASS